MTCICHPVPTLEGATLVQPEDAAENVGPRGSGSKDTDQVGEAYEGPCAPGKRVQMYFE